MAGMKRLPGFIMSLALLCWCIAARGYDFSDSTAGFSIKLPDDWTPLAAPQSADLISILSPTPTFRCVGGFVPPNARENLPALIIQEAPYPDGKSRANLTASQIQSFAAEMSDLQKGQLYSADTPVVPPLVPSMAKTATCFSNPPGFVIDARTQDKFRIHTVVFLGTDRMVLLHFFADDAAYGDFHPAADQIATSFSFHFFQRSSIKNAFSGMTLFEGFVLVVVLGLLAAAVGGIFYAVYRRRPSDNV